MVVKEAVTGALFLLSVALGMALSSRGRPLNMPLSVLHKLISLAAAVSAGFLVYGKPGFFSEGVMQSVLGGITVSLILSLIVTGAILSGAKTNKALKIAHAVVTVVAAACLGGAVII